MPIPFGSTVNPDLVNIPKRAPSVSEGGIDEFSWIDFILKLATVTPNYREGSFVGTLTGGATAPTQTFKYIQIGNYVLVTPAGNLTVNSNSTGCTITGLPPAIQATSTQQCPVAVESSGAFQSGFIILSAGNGTLQLALGNGSTTFVNDGLAKGLGLTCFGYSLSA